MDVSSKAGLRDFFSRISPALAFIAIILLTLLITFIIKHDRFPMGSGEVWNWILGLGNGQ